MPVTDQATKSDVVFFRRFPKRQHRLRRAYPSEIAQHANDVAREPLPPGLEWLVVIRRVDGRRWVRLLTRGPAGLPPDASENLAMLMFMTEATAEVVELETLLRADTAE